MSNEVQCLLCPFKCKMKKGERGICQVRMNANGKLISLVYGRPCTLHVDPIEKKPIFHLFPGSRAFSLATFGCNLGCKFCQNWQLSQTAPEEGKNYDAPPEKIIALAGKNRCRSIAYTYSEPIVYYEYTYDTSVMARQKGIKNILVTAGFINPKPMRKLAKVIDAANVDLKGFTDDYYRDICHGALKPVLKTLQICVEENVILEITNLVVPTLNDDLKVIRKMVKWIIKNLGENIPLHFSRFSPMYKLKNLPPTPVETLVNARKTALDEGLKFVYIGNVYVKDGETTFCPKCGKKLIERYGYTIMKNRMKSNNCPYCNTRVYGLWV